MICRTLVVVRAGSRPCGLQGRRDGAGSVTDRQRRTLASSGLFLAASRWSCSELRPLDVNATKPGPGFPGFLIDLMHGFIEATLFGGGVRLRGLADYLEQAGSPLRLSPPPG